MGFFLFLCFLLQDSDVGFAFVYPFYGVPFFQMLSRLLFEKSSTVLQVTLYL